MKIVSPAKTALRREYDSKVAATLDRAGSVPASRTAANGQQLDPRLAKHLCAANRRQIADETLPNSPAVDAAINLAL